MRIDIVVYNTACNITIANESYLLIGHAGTVASLL